MTGLSSGQILGFSVNPRTVEKYKRDLTDSHAAFVKDQLYKAGNVIILLSGHNYNGLNFFVVLKFSKQLNFRFSLS